MTTWSSRTTYQGHAINQGTNQIIAAANKMLATSKYGAEKSPMSMSQGGYNKGGVKASAGTHDGGGAFDLSPFNWKNRVKVLRLLGCAAWHRPKNWDNRGGSEHIHVEVCGDGTASAGGKSQVEDYYDNLNGLANRAKDADWRPAVLPILFKLDGNKSKRYAKVGCHVYDQPTTKGKNLGEVKVGDSFTPVAVVKAGGNYWFATADGKFGYEGNFTTTKPETTTPPVVVQPPKPVEPAKPVEPVEPKPTEPVPTPKIATIREHGVNAWTDYGASTWSRRRDDLNNIRNVIRASIVLTCESGSYADAESLNKAYGWGGKRAGTVPKDEASFVLHSGNDVRISTAVHWNPKTHRLLDEGWAHTLKSSTHDGITWALLQHRDSGVVSVHAATHCVPWPIGANNIKKWNDQRYVEVDAALTFLNGLRDKVKKDRNLDFVPGVLGEDFNGLRTDSKYPGGDGPGRAAKDNGWVDSWQIAKKRTGITDPQIDRIFVTLDGLEVVEHLTVPATKGTDHKAAIGNVLNLWNHKR